MIKCNEDIVPQSPSDKSYNYNDSIEYPKPPPGVRPIEGTDNSTPNKPWGWLAKICIAIPCIFLLKFLREKIKGNPERTYRDPSRSSGRGN